MASTERGPACIYRPEHPVRIGTQTSQADQLLAGQESALPVSDTCRAAQWCAQLVAEPLTIVAATSSFPGEHGYDVRPDRGAVFALSQFGVVAALLSAGDGTPPTFGGITSASVASATSVLCSWAAASDNISLAGNITYEVHCSTTPNATFNPRGAVKGSTSLTITDLLPGQTYYFRVRARDEAGNTNANAGSEISVTPDTAPSFAGATGVAQLSPSSARVSWSAATDDHDLASAIIYRVSMDTAPGQPFAADFEITGGATHLDIFGLTPGGTYYFKVRAQDTSGVNDTNATEVSITLGADAPPTFAGVQTAAAASAYTGLIGWLAGSDDVTPTGSLVYEIHFETSAGVTFTTRAVSAAGATSHTITGLAPSTRYYVKVRCRDLAGQKDSNVIELSFVTPDDVTAHPTVGNFSPAPGTPITKDTPIAFDVTDTDSIRRAIVKVVQADTGIAEVVHDGDGFCGLYSALSTRAAIAGGWRYSVRRAGGWTGTPTFTVYAVDVTGLENT